MPELTITQNPDWVPQVVSALAIALAALVRRRRSADVAQPEAIKAAKKLQHWRDRALAAEKLVADIRTELAACTTGRELQNERIAKMDVEIDELKKALDHLHQRLINKALI